MSFKKNVRSSKNWNFIVFFNFRDVNSEARAQQQQEETSIHSKGVFERMAKFSAIAKEEAENLRVQSSCTQSHIKRILGECSHCDPSSFGDVTNMIQCFDIDGHTTLTGLTCAEDDIHSIVPFVKREGSGKGNGTVE